MIHLMNINHVEKLLQLVKETRGDILINLPDGSTASLRDNHTAREMMRALPINNADVKLTLTDRRDLPLMINYMMEDCA